MSAAAALSSVVGCSRKTISDNNAPTNGAVEK
jgi:hypothetical protein